jgi:carboxyl-terminal processing protease
MKRKAVLFLILFFALILNANLFERLMSTSREYSISQGEITVYTLRAVKTRYLDKTKLDASDLLNASLNALQNQLSETLLKYDEKEKRVDVQIYNSKYITPVRRLKDLYDIAYVLKGVYSLIEKNYKPELPLEMNDIEYIAINGLLRKLDPHSYIFTPKEFEEFTSSTEGNFGGLGIVISVNEDGEIVVISPMAGTPAMEAGIEAGDIIVQIEDESAINMSLTKAVERMRGEPDTSVTLRVRREGVPELIKFELKRAVIKIESVIAEMPEPGIGYIKLTGFMENTYPTLLRELDALRKKEMKGLVLDLRNNSGGLLSQAIKISDVFLDKGIIVATVGDDEKETKDAKSQKTDLLDVPMIVLINEGSASAAEIVTAALKKNGRAVVMGRKSFGKGSVQNLFRIPGGGGLKLTVAQYLTPGNISIQSVGITPDIELLPGFVSDEKIQLFNTESNFMKEEDLLEHIVSKYVPKKPEVPDLSIRYYKPYKDPEVLRKERRSERDGVYRSDDEIEIAIGMLGKHIEKDKPLMEAASSIKDKEWETIIGKLKETGVPWKRTISLKKVDPELLSIDLISNPVLKGGEDLELKFKATYKGEGEVENLIGMFDTKIPFLQKIEIPFGTFEKSVERTVKVKLPESMPWRKEDVAVKIYSGSVENLVTTKKIPIETVPVEMPEVVFSVLAVDTGSSVNGIIEPDEEVVIRIKMKNKGKGKLIDGRAMLINTNNSKEIFIVEGTHPISLEPGEVNAVDFKVKLNDFEIDDKSNVGLAVSLYDYKTRYNAGFTIKLSNRSEICQFSELSKEFEVSKGTKIFSSASMKSVYSTVSLNGKVSVDGQCGKSYRLVNGAWVDKETLKPVKPETEEAQYKNRFIIAMPSIDFDMSPEITKVNNTVIEFSVSGGVKDVFVFKNNTKIFYERITSDSKKGEKYSIPLSLEEKTNRITIMVKGKDKERSSVSRKFIVYPDGKPTGEEDI